MYRSPLRIKKAPRSGGMPRTSWRRGRDIEESHFMGTCKPEFKKRHPVLAGCLVSSGGEGGIRTREPLWVTRFPSVRAKPATRPLRVKRAVLYHYLDFRQRNRPQSLLVPRGQLWPGASRKWGYFGCRCVLSVLPPAPWPHPSHRFPSPTVADKCCL